MGPTASGKTDVAIKVAAHLGAEIISVDSMQVYRGMDIGTAKPNLAERRGVRHHLIDVVDPEEEFSVAEFRRMGRQIIETSDVPLVVTGGSGLHFRSLVDPMQFSPTDTQLKKELEKMDSAELVTELFAADPQAGLHVDVANQRRVIRAVEITRLGGATPSARANSAEAQDIRDYIPEIEFTAVGTDPGGRLNSRIDHRLAEMKSQGLVDEVVSLQDRLGRTAGRAVGYREILTYLDGSISEKSAFELAGRNTKKLAKKQRTWFRQDPRINWIPWSDDDDVRTAKVLEALS